MADRAHAYVPKVTATELAAAGARATAGGGWVLNNRLWDCSGGGYCRIAS